MIDDTELLRRYVETRSEEAFTTLVERHLSLVYHAALRRTGHRQFAEDATQHVFITLARNAGKLSRHVVLTGWLYTTTRFAANRVMRTELRRQLREQEAYAMQDSLSSSDSDWDQLRPALDTVMDQLPNRERAAVLLRYFEGRTFADVGTALQVTEEAARKRVERGIEKLRSLLAHRGITSTSAVLAAMLSSQSGLAAPLGLATTVAKTAVTTAGSALSSTALGVTGIMSTTKGLMVIAGVVGLLALGTIGYEWHAREIDEKEIAALAQGLDLRSSHFHLLIQEAASAEKAITEVCFPG